MQTKTVTVDDNVWMPLLKVDDFLVSNMAKHKASKVCNYIINLHIRSLYFSFELMARIVRMVDYYSAFLLALFPFLFWCCPVHTR